MAINYIKKNKRPKISFCSRLSCAKALPLVYDESLSYYEVLCKVIEYLNSVIKDLNLLEENTEINKSDIAKLQVLVEELTAAIDSKADTSLVDDILDRIDELSSEIEGKISKIFIGGSQLPILSGTVEIPYATNLTAGVGIFNDIYGVQINNGKVSLSAASKNEISGRSSEYKPITAWNYDYAVKAAMCDGIGSNWTPAEQAKARERIGIDRPYEIVADVVVTDATYSLDIELDKAYSDFQIKVFMPVTQTAHNTTLRGYNSGRDVFVNLAYFASSNAYNKFNVVDIKIDGGSLYYPSSWTSNIGTTSGDILEANNMWTGMYAASPCAVYFTAEHYPFSPINTFRLLCDANLLIGTHILIKAR